MFQRRGSWAAIVIVAGIQSLALAYMVWDRVSLIANGREITLDVTPVDPRSLFRGDYVILNYRAIGQLDGALLSAVPQERQPLFVTLRQDTSGAWNPIAASGVRPDYPAAGDVILKGRVRDVWQGSGNEPPKVRMHYGIESYFVPEGTGAELEKRIGEGDLKVILAVGASGESAIKGLEIYGQRIYDEPLF